MLRTNREESIPSLDAANREGNLIEDLGRTLSVKRSVSATPHQDVRFAAMMSRTTFAARTGSGGGLTVSQSSIE